MLGTAARYLLVTFVLALCLGVMVSCGRGPAKILEMNMCTAVDNDGKCSALPSWTFKTDDGVYVSVRFENFVKGSNLVTRWYQGYQLIKEESYQAQGNEDGITLSSSHLPSPTRSVRTARMSHLNETHNLKCLTLKSSSRPQPEGLKLSRSEGGSPPPFCLY